MLHETHNLAGYLEGGLDERARSRVEAHLARCARCRAALEDMQSAGRALETLGQSLPAPEHNPDLWRAVRAEIAPQQSRRAFRLRWTPAAGGLAVASLGVAVVALVAIHPRETFEPVHGPNVSAPPATASAPPPGAERKPALPRAARVPTVGPEKAAQPRVGARPKPSVQPALATPRPAQRTLAQAPVPVELDMRSQSLPAPEPRQRRVAPAAPRGMVAGLESMPAKAPEAGTLALKSAQGGGSATDAVAAPAQTEEPPKSGQVALKTSDDSALRKQAAPKAYPAMAAAPEPSVKGMLVRAEAALAKGDAVAAEREYRNVLANTTDRSEARAAYIGLGDAAAKAKDQPTAIREYKAAAEIARDAELMAKLGNAYELAGQADEAREAFRQALVLDASNKEAKEGMRRVQPIER